MAHTLAVTTHYGAAELKTVYQKYMTIGMLIGSLVCISGAGSYHLAVWLSEDEEPIHTVRIVKYTDLVSYSASGACCCGCRPGGKA
jgi:hypothetical protein